MYGFAWCRGGVRATTVKSCFAKDKRYNIDVYRPIWWFTDKDKEQYKDFYKLTYSDCYEMYGFKRTGCACCPFGGGFEEELEIMKQYEPILYKAVNNIFGASYEYTRAFREYRARKKKEKSLKRKQKLPQNQVSLFD